MTQQVSAARTFLGGRGFSSASAVCGLGGHRTYIASVSHPIGNGCGVRGFSSQSLSNMGGSRRISYGGYGGYGAGFYGGYGYGHAGYGSLGFGGRVGHIGPRMYEPIGSCGPFRGYSNLRSDGIQGVRINEKLLKPLQVGLDPQEHEVRNHEKQEMKTLNDQFACFIDKVRYLEQQNKVLETKWNLLQGCAIPARKNLEPYYENFIGNMKRELDCLLSDREQLASEEAAVQHLVEEFKCKYEDEVKRRTSAENEFVLLKKDVDCIAMSKAELEGKLGLLSRELEFRASVYTEERAQLDCHGLGTNILLQMDNNRDLDVDCIIKNVEAWYLSIAQRSKEEANALYHNRFQELQEQRGKYSDHLKINQHEIADLTRVVQKLQCDNDNVKKQVSALETAITDVEQHGDCALKDARDKHIDLQTALQKAQDNLAGLLKDYHELLNTKLALDIEIATYRTLLEGEESRICTGNLVTIDVVKPSFSDDTAQYSASMGYCPVGGGYGGGGRSGYGRSSRNYSSRSVGQPSRNVNRNVSTGCSSADTGYFPGGESRSSIGRQSTPVGVDSSSRGGINVDSGPGAGFSSGSAQGSVNVGRGRACGSIAESGPDGGYLPGGYAPAGAIPFASGGLGRRILGGPVVVGCKPGILGGVDYGSEPCVEVGPPTGACYPGPIGAPVGACYPGPIGAPVGACYPGQIGAPVGACYPGPIGAPVGACYPGPIGAPVGVCYPGPIGAPVGVCYPGL